MNNPRVESVSVRNIVLSINDWNLSPEYQRNYVFTDSMKRYLIETIIDGFPVGGSIFLAKVNDESSQYTYDVLDGKQRLTTISDFCNNVFKYKSKIKDKYPELEGKYFRDLPKKYKQKIYDYCLPIVYLDPEITEEDKVREMFERINTTGLKLSKAEQLHSKDTNVCKVVKRICNNFRLTDIIPTATNNRFKDEKIVRQLLNDYYYIFNGNGRYEYTYKDKIDQEEISQEELDEVCVKIEKTLKFMKDILSGKEIKKEYNFDGLFNFLMYNDVSKYKIKEDKDKITDIIDNVINIINEKFVDMSGILVYSESSIWLRYKLFYNALEEYVIHKDEKRYFSHLDRVTLWDNKPHVCAICGKEIKFFEEMDVDHIIPYNEGGETNLDNAQITCIHCNRSKGDTIA